MFTNIEDAISWITSKRHTGHSFSKFKEICKSINNPQNSFYMIHVTGTDGKGSTVTFLRDLLMSQGFKVGTLQSPHYITHLDRIRINNQNIPADTFLRILNNNYEMFVKNDLSMFEMDYLIMCYYFIEEKIDFAIVEVGIGGRLDSTNVVDNTKLSIITTIGYDHMDLLGDTLEKICIEKCGIIKDNSKVLIGKLDDKLVDVVIKEAIKHNTEFYEIGEYEDLGNRRFAYDGEIFELSTYAKYQIHNAALAYEAFKIICMDKIINVKDNTDKIALKNSKWQNRFEIVRDNPRVILDGAHNIHGVEALIESFKQFSGSKCIIFSALKRKEYSKMIDMLKSQCDELIITTFENNEVIDLSNFKDYEINYDYKNAIDYAINKYDNILICGSLYFLSDVVLNYKFK